MDDFLTIATNPVNIYAALIAIGCFTTVITIAVPALKGDKLETRLKSVASRRDELRRRSRQQIKETGIRKVDEGFVKDIVDRLQLKRLIEDPTVVEKLSQAGMRGPKAVNTFYFFRFALPFVLAIVAAFYLFVLHAVNYPPMMKMAAVAAAFVGGFYAPNIYVKNAASKRTVSIMQVFPDALDLLLICVEAGMSIEVAIQKVGSEIGSGSIELAEELGLLSAELSYLPERRMAYENLAKRTNHAGVKSVATAMIQAERYGTALGNALRVMAKENREMRIAAAEKKAAQLPAKLTVPMILFFLPVIFIVILGPAVIRVQNATKPSAPGHSTR